MTKATYQLHGALGSPYSLKVRAALRYRCLPHLWRDDGFPPAARASVKIPVIPVLRFPDGRWANDSTPLLQALEAIHSERRLTPDDPADAFLALLLEDFADEWGTKIMFHYRWAPAADRGFNGFALAQPRMFGAPRAEVAAAGRAFAERQVGRMALVGCTAANAPAIEASAAAVFALIDRLAAEGPFLFGARPSVADFAWHGQLAQLARDPTPRDMLVNRFPAALAWIEALHDASGLEPGPWREGGSARDGPTAGLLALAASLYLPFLAANARALANGDTAFAITELGFPYEQAPFGYQAKCLTALRAAFGALNPESRDRATAALGAEAAALLADG